MPEREIMADGSLKAEERISSYAIKISSSPIVLIPTPIFDLLLNEP